jgi:hypothetical protein
MRPARAFFAGADANAAAALLDRIGSVTISAP